MDRRELLKFSLRAGALIGVTSLAKGSESCGLTPAQTEGPFYPVKPQEETDWDLTKIKGSPRAALGDVIVVSGQVTNLNCEPIAGTMVEIWQACASGKYNHHNDPNTAPLDTSFQYWGKAVTDEKGFYFFKTIIPGAYPADTHWIRPPHIHYKVQKWGFRELTTQLYFAGNKYNEGDHILKQIPLGERDRVVRRIEKKEFTLPGEQTQIYSAVNFDLTLSKINDAT